MASDATALELLLSMVQYHKEYLHKMQVNQQDEAKLLQQSAASCEQVLQGKSLNANEQALYQCYLDIQQTNDVTQANLLLQKLINAVRSAQKAPIAVPAPVPTLIDQIRTVAYGVRHQGRPKMVGATQNDYSTSSSDDDDNWD